MTLNTKVDNLLIEFLTEELPPQSLEDISSSFATNCALELQSFNPNKSTTLEYEVYATPRRFGVLIKNIRYIEDDTTKLRKGPSIEASFIDKFKPTKALIGFMKSATLDISTDEAINTNLKQIIQNNDGYCYVEIHKQGRLLDDVLASVINSSIKKMPIKKFMRWGANEFEFIRPVHNLLIMFGSSALSLKNLVFGLDSVDYTYGHRNYTAQKIFIKHANSYKEQLLNEGFVFANFKERLHYIQTALDNQAKICGLKLYTESEPKKDTINQTNIVTPNAYDNLYPQENYIQLLNFVTSVVEYPVIFLANFSIDFLNVPHECLISSMNNHQKYFPLFAIDNQLNNAFLFVANINPINPNDVIHDNEKVLHARLSDARFFYDMDQQKPLLYYLDNLHKVVYHNQIGTQYQRVLRLIEISKIIANMLEITDQTYLEQLIQSAKLAKADLSSQMVFEFPELQGIAGSKYARQQGMNINITKAIQRHYYPKYSNDELPEDNNNHNNNISNIVAIADKIETIVAMWNINLIPNGDKDPFALRRCAIGIIRILLHFDKNLDLYELIVRVNNIVIHDIHTYNLNKPNKEVLVTKDNQEYKNHKENNKLLSDKSNSIVDEIYNFLLQRLVNYYNTNNTNNAQYISGIIKAKVKYLNHIPLLIRTLEDINHHTDFMALLTINKRIENILKNQTLQNNLDNLSIDKLVDIKYIDNWQLEEINLYNLLLNNIPLLDEMILQQNWLGYFNKLVEFHHPINEYFEHIMIMHSDVNIKNRRITLLFFLYNTLNKICILSEI